MRKIRYLLGVVVILIIINGLVCGNEAQKKVLKPVTKLDAGDPQLMKLNMYLSSAKTAKKKGRGIIRDMRVLILKINRHLQKCTSTRGGKLNKKNPLLNQETSNGMIFKWSYNLPKDLMLCTPIRPIQISVTACNSHVDHARYLSDYASEHTKCIKMKYSYLERVEAEVERYCSKGKLTYELNRKTKAKMNAALTKTKDLLAKIDPIITQISDKIREYKACIVLKKTRTARVKR